MKKLLSIVVLGFSFFTPSFSQIIELGKCYVVDTYDEEMVRSSWNIEDFQKLRLFYFKCLCFNFSISIVHGELSPLSNCSHSPYLTIIVL